MRRTKQDSPLVKICGITNVEDALLAAHFGADQLGFNFYRKSPRYISPERAFHIIQLLPDYVASIGVFVNEPIELIMEITQISGVIAVQLHGDEDAKYVAEVRTATGLEVLKSVAIEPGMNPEEFSRFWTGANAILLDRFSRKIRGGTGEVVDWDTAYQFGVFHGPIYLAGGLSEKNIQEAIRRVRPYAVDACSRLETSPGKKDPNKLEAFIKNAKSA